ncbi:unnamed protein product [Camellia sinensis]
MSADVGDRFALVGRFWAIVVCGVVFVEIERVGSNVEIDIVGYRSSIEIERVRLVKQRRSGVSISIILTGANITINEDQRNRRRRHDQRHCSGASTWCCTWKHIHRICCFRATPKHLQMGLNG